VFFDDLQVTHHHSPIVAGADFYPFGLPMEGREITQEDYRWGYQGQYAEKDTTTGWNQFQLRMYDARFGRWLSIDPYGQFASPYLAMGNAPNMGTDPDGGFSSGGGGSLLWKWVANPTTVDNLAGYFKRTLLGNALNIAKELAPAVINNTLRQTLNDRALQFTKDAISNIAKRQSERDFVIENYDKPGYESIAKDYPRKYDRYGDALPGPDRVTPGDGYQYSGFVETGTTNVNDYMGSAPGPYKVFDSETSTEFYLSRNMPKVQLDVSKVKSRYVVGYGNSRIINGEGFMFEPDNTTINAAAVGISFKSRKAADNFFQHHYKKAYNNHISYLKRRYFKIHK
jgi:RHS repeat-associated protein